MADPVWSVDVYNSTTIDVFIDDDNDWEYFKYSITDPDGILVEMIDYTTSQDVTFSDLEPGTLYKIMMSWSSSTTGEGNYDTIYAQTWFLDRWSWIRSNGEATRAQTRAARTAIDEGGETSEFSYLVWNDLVDKVSEALGCVDVSWDSEFLSRANTKMYDDDKVLTAARFNSVRHNIERYIDTGLQTVYRGDLVYGWYFDWITDALNIFVDSINGEL